MSTWVFSWIRGVSSLCINCRYSLWGSVLPTSTHHPNIQLRCVTHLACSPELNCVMNHMWKCSLCCLEFSPSPIQIFTQRLVSSSAWISPQSMEQVWKRSLNTVFVCVDDERSRAAPSLCCGCCCGVFLYCEWWPLLKTPHCVSAPWSHRVKANL